jgi:DNA replication protein
MKQFSGFPVRMQFTSIPNLFFSAVMPQITDITELKTVLHIFEALYRKRGYPRFVTHNELLGNRSLMTSLRQTARLPEEALRQALEMATQRGVILHLTLASDNGTEDLYFLNTASQRQVVERIQTGKIKLGGLKAEKQTYVDTEEPPDIFALYEQNIGLLTPLIAEQLREAETVYGENWIRDAIKEAVRQEKRKWSYISAILEHWASEGKSDGTHRRHPAKKTDPDKYVKGVYGHMVRR